MILSLYYESSWNFTCKTHVYANYMSGALELACSRPHRADDKGEWPSNTTLGGIYGELELKTKFLLLTPTRDFTTMLFARSVFFSKRESQLSNNPWRFSSIC